MKHYWIVELTVAAVLTAALLELRVLGGALGVIPTVIGLWIVLQLVSSIAFCNAINKRTIIVYPGLRGSKETYGLAAGTEPGWLVMRHVWAYDLLRKAPPAASAPPVANGHDG